MNLIEKANELEVKIDEISKIKWPLQKQAAAERIVFQAVELIRDVAVEVEAMRQAHGWHLEEKNKDG